VDSTWLESFKNFCWAAVRVLSTLPTAPVEDEGAGLEGVLTPPLDDVEGRLGSVLGRVSAVPPGSEADAAVTGE
jgi:hypothetical protein